MEIKVLDTIGFCFGVKKAVNLSRKALLKKNTSVFSVGPIIHNPQVVKELSKMGLTPLDDIKTIKNGTVIISSHGAGAKLKEKIKKGNLKIIDATCPFVKKIQEYVKKLYKEGYKVLIVGKKEHPEVKALANFTNDEALVVKDAREAMGLDLRGLKIGVVSQSTYSQSALLEIASILLQKPFLELRIFNTICKDTIKRQDAVRRLTNVVDMVIVVGGKDSANTRRLVEVCKNENKPAYHIEDKSDIDSSWLIHKKSIGIASGASTPDWVVKDVVKEIRRRYG